MYLTLDILSTSDPSYSEDRTSEWELNIEEDKKPKMKFPLKLKDDLSFLELEFDDPVLKEIKSKKKELDKEAKIVEKIKRKSNKDKKNLF